MKFYDIKINSVNLLVAFLLCSTVAFTQNNVASPYSRFGLGSLNDHHSPAYRTMGGASVAMTDYYQLNINNPASYSFLSQYHPVFEVDFSSSFLTLESNGVSSNVRASSINKFALGLPLNKRLGLGMGFMPYSSTGYNITAIENDPDAGEINYIYKGTGGLNKAFLGFSGQLINKGDTSILSIGADASFIFGGGTQTRRIEFPDLTNSVNTNASEATRVNGFVFNTGLLFKQKLNKKLKFSAGATFSLNGKLSGSKDLLVNSYAKNSTQEVVQDTLLYSPEVGGSVNVPMSFSLGTALEINNNFIISAQVKQQNWGDYSEDFGNIPSDTLQNSSIISLGFAYRPFDVFSSESFLQRVQYRGGVHYGNTPVKYDNNPLTEFGMSFGLGIPMSSKRHKPSVTTLHLGVQHNIRSTTDANAIKESATTVYFGISIMPGAGDRWFNRRKIN